MKPLLHAIYYQPWLFTLEAHAAMRRAASNAGLFTAPLQNLPEPQLLSVERGVGTVSIMGVLMKRSDLYARVLLGATDMDEIAEALIEARDRADVQAVLLAIDSPGGTVNGTPELAALVAGLSKRKYVYAFSDGQMCSAAYWIASQADVIFATPSARVGSIGVLLLMLDESEAFKQAGLKVELFAAGKYKSIGVPDETWTPYPQHSVFWNLQHAARLIPPKAPNPPLQLFVPLAGGIAQPVINALLSFVNDSNAEAEAFFNQADARGVFWST